MAEEKLPLPNIRSPKYEPGPLPEICAPRSNLIKKIDAEAAKRLVYISAPAGSGKTVSARLWAKGSGRKTVWVGLDTLDNSPFVFYKMVCTGLLAAQPDNNHMAAWLRSPAFNDSPVEHTVNMLTEFNMDGNSYALVLDDFHTVTNQELLKSLSLIQRRLPVSVVTLLLSRSKPTEIYMEMISAGRAALIEAGELMFNAAEVKAFFMMMGRKQEEGAAAFSFTGGWALGINALAQSVKPISGEYGGQFLERYMKKHFWNELDDGLRSFILKSAVLDEMPVTLCERVTGSKEAGDILEGLRARNSFVSRERDVVYRYHHLFLDFLRAQPEYLQMEKKKLWALAAEYYIKEEDYLPSRNYALKSGIIKLNLLALEKFTGNRGYSFDECMNYSPEFLEAESFEALCERCPVFYITYAWAAFVNGDAPSFEKYMDRLMRQLPVIFEKYPRFMETGVSMIVLDYRTPFAVQVGQASLPPASINTEDESLKTITMSLHLPFFHRSCRDFCELTDREIYGGIKETFGKLLKKHYEMVMHSVEAGLLLEQYRTAEALTEAQDGESMLTDQTSKEIRFGVHMHLAAVLLALGKKKELGECLRTIEKFINRDAQFLRFNFLAFTSRIKIGDGDQEAAREWLENYFVTEETIMKPYKVYQYFTTLRAYILLDETKKAYALAKNLRRFGKDFHRPQDAAEAGALFSVISWADDRHQESQDMLEKVLTELQPLGFIRLIADEGAAILPPLRRLVKRMEQKQYRGGLDSVYVNNVYLAAYSVSRNRRGILASRNAGLKLSERQKSVLLLLAKGHTREGIVERTGLTVNTVKTHLGAVYEKLGAANAAEAVARARELGIIE